MPRRPECAELSGSILTVRTEIRHDNRANRNPVQCILADQFGRRSFRLYEGTSQAGKTIAWAAERPRPSPQVGAPHGLCVLAGAPLSVRHVATRQM